MSNNSPTVTVTKELEYSFTPEEIRNLGFSIANAVGDMEALEEEKTAFMSDLKEKLKEAKAQVKLLAAKIRTGTEVRMIECSIDYDFGAKMVRTCRTDTGAVVEERDGGRVPLVAHDRQRLGVQVPAGEDGGYG